MKFAHISDCHLGGWRDERMTELGCKAFSKAITETIDRDLNFALFTGDLFDTSYPKMSIADFAFKELRRLKDSGIMVYFIKGSHDYSVMGNSFLNLVESSGLGINVHQEIDGELQPTRIGNCAIYGYPGKHAGLEVADIRNLTYNTKNFEKEYKILALHTAMDVVASDLPIETVKFHELPKMDYYALGHIHRRYNYNNLVYPSCTFPNSFHEMEELTHGAFVIHDTETNETEFVDLPVINTKFLRTNHMKHEFEENSLIVFRYIGDKNTSGLDTLRKQADEKNTILLINTNKQAKKAAVQLNELNPVNTEDELIKKFTEDNPSEFNKFIPMLFSELTTSKDIGETVPGYEERVSKGVLSKLQ